MRSIIQLVDSSRVGGIETHILKLSKALISRGYRCQVAFIDDHGPHPMKAHLDRFEIPWCVLPGGIQARARFLRAHAQLVNTHGYKAGILGRLLCRLYKIPVVSTWHTAEAVNGKLALYQWLDRATAPLAPAMTVNHQVAAALPTQSTLIHNFISSPTSEQSAGDAIGFVGALTHNHAPDLFCQLMNTLKTVHPPRVFGDGPMRAALTQRYAGQIQFDGAVPTMKPWWPQLSLLCITSRNADRGRIAREAMANGVPVIAFAQSNLSDLIRDGENGFLVPAGDLVGMRSVLKRWLRMTRSERQPIIAHARHTIRQYHSASAVLSQVINVYEQQNAPRPADRIAVPASPCTVRQCYK